MSYPPPNLSPRTDSSPAVPGSHAADHTAERNAINAIVAELGANPSLGYPTLQALLEAILTKIGLSSSPTGGGSGGSGGSGGGTGGGSGSGGGSILTSGTHPYEPTGTFPIDLTALSLVAVEGGQAGHNFGKWFTGNLSSYGFYARTLAVEEEHDNNRWITFVNLDAPTQRQTFDLGAQFYGSSARPIVGMAGKLTQLVRGGRVWNATSHTFEDTGNLGSDDADNNSNYVLRSDGYVWSTFRAVWKLDGTGTVSKVADVPTGYYAVSAVLDEVASWFLLFSDTLPGSSPQYCKIATFDLATNTFSVLASMTSQQSINYIGMFNGGIEDGSSPGASVLSDGRLLGRASGTNGSLQVVTQALITTPVTPKLCEDGWTVQQTIPSTGDWILAISKNGTQYQITAAAATDSFVFVAPTAEPIHNLHWHVGFEGLVARWNQGTKLCEQWFSMPV
jgi:hypothetical protein